MRLIVRPRTPNSILSGIAAATLALACGGSTSEPPGPAVEMAFTPESRNQQATVGQNVPVPPVVVVTDAEGRPVPGISVTFSASPGGVVEPAIVQTDAAGRSAVTRWRLRTASGGNTLLAETIEVGLIATSALGVPGPPVEFEILSPQATDLTFGIGDSHQLVLRGTDGFGNDVENPAATYESENSAVASVSATGLITGEGLGSTTIVVRAADMQRTVPVTVLSRVGGIAGRPFGIAVAPAGTYALVTRQDDDMLTRIALPQLGRGPSISTGSTPGDVAFSPDGAVVYVMNVQGMSMSVLNASTGSHLATVPVPHAAVRVRVAPGGGIVYALSNSSGLCVVNSTTLTIERTMAVGGNGLAVSPDGQRVYVSNEGGVLSEVDPEAGTVSRTVSLGGRPQEVVLSADGTEIWVANEASWVDVVDAATFAPIGRVPLSAGAFGMALSPDGTQLWTSAPAAGKVFVIDRAARQLSRTETVGSRPRRIAFDTATGYALVANEGGWVDALITH